MSSARPAAAAAILAVLAACSLAANAQQVFRIVGPDGRVTFSDRPPPEGKATPAPSLPLPAGAAAGQNVAANNPALPFELRSAAGKYPVTLYSRTGCGPCDAGRSYLTSRGIPFSEKTIQSQEDVEALQRLAGTPATLPFMTIGGQQLKGYSQVEWGQFLDAAGYPRTSQLPAGYRQPQATPLVAGAPLVPPPGVPAGGNLPGDAPAATAPTPSGPNPANPAGIQF